MTKPVLLIDIDGVLCPFMECEGYEMFHLPEGDWVWMSQKNGERLARLRQRFDLMWATAWEHQANERILAPLGLEDPLPYIDFTVERLGPLRRHILLPPEGAQRRAQGGSWKLAWIAQWGDESGRPLAWIDDDIHEDAIQWAQERADEGVRTLALRIPANTGLEDNHVEYLEVWADDGKADADGGADSGG